jgi:hypothetical protein
LNPLKLFFLRSLTSIRVNELSVAFKRPKPLFLAVFFKSDCKGKDFFETSKLLRKNFQKNFFGFDQSTARLPVLPLWEDKDTRTFLFPYTKW